MIDVKQLTLKYPSGKGVFDLDFSVKKGEVHNSCVNGLYAAK